MKKPIFGWNYRLCSLIGVVVILVSALNFNVVFAQSPVQNTQNHTQVENFSQCGAVCGALMSQAAAPEGEIIIVSNTGEDINGNVSNPAALIDSPGPDGISLNEAMTAAQETDAFDVIRFDPSLKGAVINLLGGLPVIGNGNLMIDGNIDSDTTPDITIDGTNCARDRAFIIYGGSRVMIKGFTLRNFAKHAISISADTAAGKSTIEDIVIYQNSLSSAMNAIEVGMWQQNHAAIHNVEIVSNNLHDSDGGIAVHPGFGEGATDNEVSGLSIIDNTINNPGYHIGIFLSPSSTTGLSRNSITNVEIRGNIITGHSNSSILIDASNQVNCNDNVTSEVVIAENIIDGPHVTIEVVGESGAYSTGNTVSNMTITGNVLSGGGIQFGSATGFSAHDNLISTVIIERNKISSCLANGIFLIAGSGGAYNNRLENFTLRNNFINNCADAGILLHGDTSSSPNNTINNITITNQTLVNNGNSWAGGLNVNTKDASNTITGVTLTNSILWGNDGADAIRGALVPGVVAYNLIGDGRFVGTNNNFYQDPQFVDPASNDYHLQNTSPGVETGDPLATNVGAKDLDNRVRTWDGNTDSLAIVDRGAWEYNAPAMQEMVVLGNSTVILDGDRVPALWDATDFGAAQTGGSTLQTFTIENSGTEALHLTGDPIVEITGTHAGDLTVITQPANLVSGGESVSFAVMFTPQATGLREAVVSIANDDSDENPYTFAIVGTGTEFAGEPEMNVLGIGISIITGDLQPAAEDGTDFGGAVVTGEPVQRTFTIENTGNAELSLTGDPRVVVTGAQAGEFVVITHPGSIVANGDSVTFTIEFTPSVEGLREATVSIASDDNDENPYTFAIQGTGISQFIKQFIPFVIRP